MTASDGISKVSLFAGALVGTDFVDANRVDATQVVVLALVDVCGHKTVKWGSVVGTKGPTAAAGRVVWIASVSILALARVAAHCVQADGIDAAHIGTLVHICQVDAID